MISGDDLSTVLSKKDALIKEIKELRILLSHPSSVLLIDNEPSHFLTEYFWQSNNKLKECYRVANFAEPTRPLCSFNPSVINDVREMVNEWRAEACAEVAQMTPTERQSWLAGLGYATADSEYAKVVACHAPNQSQPGPRSRGRPKGRVTHRRGSSEGESSTSRSTSRSNVSRRAGERPIASNLFTTTRKRKSTLIPRGGAQAFKHARLSSSVRTNVLKPKHGSPGDLLSNASGTSSATYNKHTVGYREEEETEEGDTVLSSEEQFDQVNPDRESKPGLGVHDNAAEQDEAEEEQEDDEDEELQEEEDDEEDQLTAIVRRQREAFSARVAAGRPSIRNQTKTNPNDLSRPLSGASSASIARVLQTNKVLREWKLLARKVLCKVARQSLAVRREKIASAKRAARECARVVRQRALLSHKAGKDAANRGHRLCREIATNWRNSAQSINNGNGPLTVNGITFPTSTDSTGSITMLRHSDYHAYGVSVRGDTPGGITGPDGTGMESAAAARRRAERAAAEQRRADLELLEARRQQRKLNFLITQTELYAHFMARKMDAVITTDSGGQNDATSAQDDLTQWSGTSDTGTEAAETTRILRRLEESDEEIEEQSIDDPKDTAVIAENQGLTTPGKSARQSDRPSRSPGCSSIAVAAKAAATRLGINTEDEYDIQRIKSEAMSKVRLAVERERDRRSQMQQMIPTPVVPADRQHRIPDPKTTTVQPPQLFQGNLKAYQLQGLNWLLGLFDQGINGILADEMGLGKTIQTIAFLGYLAETYNLWGPFLIVSPASTLHNWTQEFARFLPAFRIVPYWGSPAERKVLRRFWFSARHTGGTANSTTTQDPDDGAPSEWVVHGQPGTREAEMHVVITSYQVVLQDAKFINKTAWSYIVLDEAHAIKSTSSLRWRILLSFKCRNRLLLTGTPIQNTMQELWALLHFIMPSLFDSHDEFANWFSRDIESQATQSTSGGTGLSTSKLNANQLSRLHLILKPFMLRRTKTEVEHEISKKTEILRYCPLSHRQRILYDRLRNKIRLEDLSSVIGSDPSGGSSDVGLGSTSLTSIASTATTHLINLVMQLRKVCNHPDLWEPRDVRFSCFHGAILPTDHELVGSNRVTQHSWWLPLLLYDQGLLPGLSWKYTGTRTQLVGVNIPTWPITTLTYLSADKLALLVRLFAIFHPTHVHADLWHNEQAEPDLGPWPSSASTKTVENCRNLGYPLKCFSFSRILGLSVQELCLIACTGIATHRPRSPSLAIPSEQDIPDPVIRPGLQPLIRLRTGPGTCCRPPLFQLDVSRMVHPSFMLVTMPDAHLNEPALIPLSSWDSTNLSSSSADSPCCILRRSLALATVDKVRLKPLELHIRTPNFTQKHVRLLSLSRPIPSELSVKSIWSASPSIGLPQPVRVSNLSRDLELVSLATRIADSGKLVALDALLNELKPAGHRVLVYSQMTRMIDILEEFMLHRNHAYLRLDGSSRLCDRRDMVAQWQTNPRWFVFLLSTRAGGLGINLTAADTVIFYDSDWNPTVDQQAMDRAHRLGQTKPVTVYRLVCKNTVEGRMMQRAEEKRAMQQMVIQSGQDGHHPGNLIPTSRSQEQLTSSDMVSLLLDDDELVTRLQQRRRTQVPRGRPAKSASTPRLTGTGNGVTDAPENDVTTGSSTSLNPMTESAGCPMLVDTALERKRQALWAEMPRVPMGRPKKIRPIEPIGSAASAAAAASSSNSNNNTQGAT